MSLVREQVAFNNGQRSVEAQLIVLKAENERLRSRLKLAQKIMEDAPNGRTSWHFRVGEWLALHYAFPSEPTQQSSAGDKPK